jgi:hypothetical protein
MTEETFARELWGDEAYRNLHTSVFYRPSGRCYALSQQLSSVLQSFLGKHLKAPLDVSKYRHLAAAFGRHLLAIEIDASEDTMTTEMDAAAGRSTALSEMVYALDASQLGNLNDRSLAVHRATDRLWQSKLLKLPVKGAVATSEQIDSARTPLNVDGSLQSATASSSHDSSILASFRTILGEFEESLLRKLVPAVVQQLQSQSTSVPFPVHTVPTSLEEEEDHDVDDLV